METYATSLTEIYCALDIHYVRHRTWKHLDRNQPSKYENKLIMTKGHFIINLKSIAVLCTTKQ